MWRFLDQRFEEVLGGLMLGVMVTVSFINVVVRYCTSFSFAWTEELTINFFVWVVLLGASRSFREGGNLCMSILYDSCPKPLRLVFFLAGIVICIVFFAALGVMGVIEVMDEIDLEVTSEALEIPVWLYTCGTPLLSALIIFRIMQRAHELLTKGKY